MAVQKDKDTHKPASLQLSPELQAELDLTLRLSEIRFLIEKKQISSAAQALRSILSGGQTTEELGKTLRQTCMILMQYLHSIKQYGDLLDFFQSHRIFFENDASALSLAGAACHSLGNTKDAIANLNKSIDLAPALPDAYLLLGDIFSHEHPMKASHYYFKYHDRNPTIQGTKLFIKKITALCHATSNALPCKQVSIAFLGNFTLEPLRPYLEAECLKRFIQPRFFFGGYDQYIQEMSDPKSALYQFDPSITFLFLDSQAFLPELFNNFFEIAPENRFPMASAKLDQVKSLVDKFLSLSRSRLSISNFPLPRDYLMGVYDPHSVWGQKAVLLKMNEYLQQLATSSPQRLCVLDTDKALSNSGKSTVANEKIRYLAKMIIPEKAMPELARELIRHIRPTLGMTKKCLVLDLDNTLWGGVLGEDGLEGIRLGLEPPGNAFYEFQKTIKTLHYRGILLAINSKNDLSLVREAFEKHPYMQLKLEDFSCIRANWQDKAQNMREIASELNLGLDSFVYMDDNPAERFLIQTELPEVQTVEMPEDFSEFTHTLMHLDAFEILHLTEEDKQRKYLYQTESKRNELKNQFTDINEYLKALDIAVSICPADSFAIPRIAQLTQRTNQFNLTTRRYTEADIKSFSQSPSQRVYYLKTNDRFGDHGITGVCITTIKPKTWEIDSFMLSCRIIGRGIEQAFIHHICNEARSHNAVKLLGRYLPTKKNQLAANFLLEMHFDIVSKNDQETVYEMDLEKTLVALPSHIRLNVNDD